MPSLFPFETISDTARLVALYRALESERQDALFHDPYARLLAGERGEHLVQTMPYGLLSGWGTVVRTYIFDQIILRLVEQENINIVLNLAAGLDTRPYRLPLPASLLWIEVDLPELLSNKEARPTDTKPKYYLERFSRDLTNTEVLQSLLQQTNNPAQKGLVLTEGLLLYLTESQVASMATVIHKQATFQWWLTDLISSPIAEVLRSTYTRHFAEGHVHIQFAPKDGISFFRHYGWKVAEFRSFREEAKRLKRLPLDDTIPQVSHITPDGNQKTYRNMAGGFSFKSSP